MCKFLQNTLIWLINVPAVKVLLKLLPRSNGVAHRDNISLYLVSFLLTANTRGMAKCILHRCCCLRHWSNCLLPNWVRRSPGL